MSKVLIIASMHCVGNFFQIPALITNVFLVYHLFLYMSKVQHVIYTQMSMYRIVDQHA